MIIKAKDLIAPRVKVYDQKTREVVGFVVEIDLVTGSYKQIRTGADGKIVVKDGEVVEDVIQDRPVVVEISPPSYQECAL